jgi:hypothetical protein
MRCRLRGQTEFELLDQKLEFWLGLSVACQQHLAAVGRGQMNIDHLDGGELLKTTARDQSWRQGMEATVQRDLQTISQERDEDMGFDPVLVLMEDRPYGQIALQVLNASSTATSWV